MDMGNRNSPCGNECSCMHNGLSGISSVVQCSLSKGIVWKSSSSSASSSRFSEVTRVLLEVVSGVGYCTFGMLQGEETSSSEVSSSSEGLHVNLLHTGLRKVVWYCMV